MDEAELLMPKCRRPSLEQCGPLHMEDDNDDNDESEEEDMNFASGCLILDGLDEDFLAEVSGLGSSTLPFFSTIF